MATIQNSLKSDASVIASLNDSSTGWAYNISKNMATLGFVQQNDTGQAVWAVSTITLTQATVSGGNVVYAFSSLTGPAIRIGMSVTITGFVNGGNNVTATITAKSGTSSGTFTVVNGTGVNETHAGTAVTVLSTLPSVQSTLTNALYEIWKSNDGLTDVFIKFEYGQCQTNVPGMAVTFGTAVNGSGTLTGNVSTRELSICSVAGSAGGGTTNVYECDFFSVGASPNGSCLGILLWRNVATVGAVTTAMSGFIGFERSKDFNGNDTNSYITYLVGGGPNNNPSTGTSATNWNQGSVFLSGSTAVGTRIPYAATIFTETTVTSFLVGNDVADLAVFPLVGYQGNPLTIVKGIRPADATEGGTYTAGTPYGGTHTYLMTKAVWAQRFGNSGTTSCCFAMRYE